jgi:hypothetical protein
VDPVPDPLVITKSYWAGNRTRNPGSVARNSDHYKTDGDKRRNVPPLVRYNEGVKKFYTQTEGVGNTRMIYILLEILVFKHRMEPVMNEKSKRHQNCE